MHAYIVTTAGEPDSSGSGISSVIDAVADQTEQPDYVTLVAVGAVPAEASRRLRDRLGPRASVVAVPAAENFGDALKQAMTAPPTATGASWLWLLHDDTRPEPGALAALLTATSQGAAIAVVGPKQVGWEKRDELLELGIEATRTGRRVPLGVATEIDQGQYDDRVDVLAVGTAGALVRADAWQRLRGLDPALGPFGDGLEFGRRARRAGYRVVVAPKAVVAHRQASLEPPAASFGPRRAAQMYNWLLAVPAGVPILLLPLLLIWAPLRAIGRLVTRRPAYAAAELTALGTVVHSIPAVRRARRNDRATAVLPRSRLRALETTPRALEARRRHSRRVAQERMRPIDLVDAPTRQRLAAYRRATRIAFGGAMIIVAAFSFYFWYPLLSGITGGNWGQFPLTQASLWEQAWSPWVYGAVGSEGPTNALLSLFSLVAAPFWLVGASASQVAVAFLALAMPLSAANAWLLSGSFTRHPWLRATSALVWALQPALLLSVGTGDVSAALLWSMLPLSLTGLWRALRPVRPLRVESVSDTVLVDRPDSVAWAAVAALSGAAAASGAPIVAPILLLTGIVLAVAPASGELAREGRPLDPARGPANAGRQKTTTRDRFAIVATAWLPAALLTAPTVAWALPRLGTADGWLALLVPNGTQPCVDVPWWAWGPVVLLSLGALASLIASVVRGNRWGTCAVAGGVAAGITWAYVAVPGTGAALAPFLGLALLLAALAALPDTRLNAEGTARTAGERVSAGVSVVALVVGIFTFLGVLVMGPLSAGNDTALQPTDGHAAPVVSEQAAKSETQGRTLVLTAVEGEPTVASLWRQGARSQADLSLGLRVSTSDTHLAAEETLATAVAYIAARPAPEAVQVLADMAVELILLNPGAPSGVGTLEANLDSTDGLERIGTTEVGTMWRVRSTGRIYATSRPSFLVLAEPSSPGWWATADGEPLEVIPDPDPEIGWRQAFAVPTQGGELAWGYRPGWAPWWQWATLASLVGAVILVFPWRRSNTEWLAVDGVPLAPTVASTASADVHSTADLDLTAKRPGPSAAEETDGGEETASPTSEGVDSGQA